MHFTPRFAGLIFLVGLSAVFWAILYCFISIQIWAFGPGPLKALRKMGPEQNVFPPLYLMFTELLFSLVFTIILYFYHYGSKKLEHYQLKEMGVFHRNLRDLKSRCIDIILCVRHHRDGVKCPALPGGLHGHFVIDVNANLLK